MKSDVKSFIFYTAYKEKLKRLTDAQLGKLIRLMCDYKETGEEPKITDMAIAFAFDVVRYDMDTNTQKYEATVKARKEAGAKGGKQKAENVANVANANFATKNKQTKQTVANVADNDNVNVNDNDNVNENVNVNESKRDAPAPKRRLGIFNNVKLTEDELQTLIDEYPDSYQEKIENLSQYMKSKGTYYHDHFATIMKWAREDEAKKPQNKGADNLNQFYDMVRDWAQEGESQ